MTSRMPPVPPGNQSNKGTTNRPSVPSNDKLVKHEHHPNAAEKGETANIKQNTTNKGFFRGRRFDKRCDGHRLHAGPGARAADEHQMSQGVVNGRSDPGGRSAK
jgi:hypothetical protein